MLRIVLVRPGQTDYDHQLRIRGTLDVPMNPQGLHEVDDTIEQLRGLDIDAVYSGPCQPTRETAEALAGAFDAKLKVLDLLANLDAGLWQGKLIADVKQHQPRVYRQWQENPDGVCPPSGESVSEVRARIRTALDKVWKKHHKGSATVVIVAPEPLASVIHAELARERLGDLWKAEGHCGWWEIIEYEKTPVASGH